METKRHLGIFETHKSVWGEGLFALLVLLFAKCVITSGLFPEDRAVQFFRWFTPVVENDFFQAMH